MKQAEIAVGGVYACKVSDKIVPVRVDWIGEKWDSLAGGRDANGYRGQMRWRARGTNLKTGRAIDIKSAQRLRRPLTAAEREVLGA